MRMSLVLLSVMVACSVTVLGHGTNSITGEQHGGIPRPTPEDHRLVLLYVHHPLVDEALHGHVACSPEAVLPLPRWIPSTDTPLHDTLLLLLQGVLTDHELALGFRTGFPLAGLDLASLTLVEGTLTIAFSDPQYSTTGGTCRVTLLWSQIEKTALQFPEVDHVLHDPPDLFQP